MKTQVVSGIELAYVDRGAGVPVLLVHGFPLDHTMWNAQIDAFSEHYRVIAPDLPGFGHSGVTDATATMERFADDLAALLVALEVDVPIVLCGLSMGGYVAFEFWRKYRSKLRGLILADTRAGPDSPEMAAARLDMADRVLIEGPAPLVDGMSSKLFAEATLQSRPEVVESLRAVMMDTDPKGIAAAARGMAQRTDFTKMLGDIDCPALVIVGRLDILSTTNEMDAMARAIGGARFAELADCGHMSPLEQPAEFNAAVLEFLAGL